MIAGTLNQQRRLRDARRQGRPRHAARSQIVQMVAQAQRSRAPIQRLADQVSGWFVPAVIAVALIAFAAWATVRAGAALRLWPGRGGVGADHRLPLRARACDADVDHGRRRARRAGRRADQERRGAGADGKGRHAGDRQDRHADRRQAGGDGDRRRRRVSTRTRCCGSPPASRARASIRWPRAIVAAAKERELALAQVEDFDSPDRQGRARHGRGQARRDRQRAFPGRTRRSTPSRLHAEGRPSCAATARPWSSSPSTASRPACSRSPIRSRPRRRAALEALRADKACASSC